MDFASLMSTAIKTSSSPPPSDRSQKFLKRSDLEAQRQATYHQEQGEVQAAREARANQKRKHEEEEAVRTAERNEKRRRLAEESRLRREEEEEKKERARRKRWGLPETPARDTKDGSQEPVPVEEDIEDTELVAKLRKIGEPAIVFGETHVQRLKRYRNLTTPKNEQKLSKGPIPTTLDLLPESELKVHSALPKDK